jgi:hypothetical protein
LRLGVFDPAAYDPLGYRGLRPADLNYTAHAALSLRAAREGIVLLENKPENRAVGGRVRHREDPAGDTAAASSSSALPTLPIDIRTLGGAAQTALRKPRVAVIGPNADNGANMQGVDCHGVPPFLITPRMALEAHAGGALDVAFAAGSGMTRGSAAQTAAAVAAAATAELVLLVLGTDSTVEYEMRDRASLLLPAAQLELLAAVTAAATAPVVVALMSGGVTDTSAITANPNVSALLWIG